MSTSSLPQLSTVYDAELTTTEVEPITVLVGEQLIDNYQVTDDGSTTATSSSQLHLVETVLEFLVAQLQKLLNKDNKSTDHIPLSIDQIKQDDYQVSFYTGFPSFTVFWSFTSFLDLLLTNFIAGESNQMPESSINLQSLLQRTN